MDFTRRSLAAAGLALAAAAGPPAAFAASEDDRRRLYDKGVKTLQMLERQDTHARVLAPRARGILVFPSVVKAGFIFGGQSGAGVLLERGRPTSYYQLSGGSFGLQAGGEDFALALFFMTNSALGYLKSSQGWSLGTGPSAVIVNKGAAAALDIRNLTQDVYVFPFNQKGLMGDLSLQGTKISRINPS